MATPKQPKCNGAIRKHKDIILNGCWVAIDPATGSTSCPGYALYNNGVLVESGALEPTRTAINPVRLNEIVLALQEPPFNRVELLVIEGIKKGRTTHIALIHSVGAIKGALGVPTVEVFPSTWRQYAGRDYCDWKKACQQADPPVDTDEQDAVMIGYTALCIARSFNGKSKRKRKRT